MFGNGGTVHGHERPVGALAEVVQVVGEHLLADAAFAEKEHGGFRGRHLVDHVAHRVEAGGNADHANAVFGRLGNAFGNAIGGGLGSLRFERPFREVADLQEAQIVLRVFPVFHRLAHHATFCVPHAAAFDFAPQNRAPHEGARIAAGVAGQHPANRFVADAVTRDVRFSLGTIDQIKVAEVVPASHVDIERDGFAMHDAFE